jgi:hypothetical protein
MRQGAATAAGGRGTLRGLAAVAAAQFFAAGADATALPPCRAQASAESRKARSKNLGLGDDDLLGSIDLAD